MALAVMGSATVLAKPEKSAAVTPFNGAGEVYVASMPPPIQQGNTLRFTNEQVTGKLDSCEWLALEGADFDSFHDSIVNVDKSGNANGTMHGTFTLTATDGSTLVGTFHARIRGTISGYVYDWHIIDEGVWKSTSGTGVFEGVKAWGSLSAELEWNGNTLAGDLIWEGKYISAKE